MFFHEFCVQRHSECSSTATVCFIFFIFFVEGLWSPDFVVVVFGQTEGTRSVGMTAVESVLLTEMLL